MRIIIANYKALNGLEKIRQESDALPTSNTKRQEHTHAMLLWEHIAIYLTISIS